MFGFLFLLDDFIENLQNQSNCSDLLHSNDNGFSFEFHIDLI